MPFDIVPRPRGFGALVQVDDPASLLAESARERLDNALSRFGVLIFPGLLADDAMHVALAGIFGEIQTFGTKKTFRSANFEEDGTLLRSDSDKACLLRLNWLWHADGVYRERDIRAVLLRAEAIETGGGDTEFADLVAAFDALPRDLQSRIETLSVEYSFEHMILTADVPPVSADERSRLPRARHALVQTLADGRRSLRLSPPYMERVIGWGRDESLALFRQLVDFATRPDFLFRHHWSAGDMVAWDNRWTMHRVLPYDDSGLRRDMRGAVVLV
ncbi:TauD/TfdA dioxygenase family protein [Sphingopyxis sp. 550A]